MVTNLETQKNYKESAKDSSFELSKLELSELEWEIRKNEELKEVDRKAEVEKIIINNKSSIESAARKYGVDKYLIAAIIYYEQLHLSRGEDFHDEALARAHVGTKSIGLGQIQVRRAIDLENKGSVEKITVKEKKAHIADKEWQARIDRLINPSWNIRYVAAYLQQLQNIRLPKFPAITSRPDILATIYNLGTTKAHPNPIANDYGEAVNKLIQRVKQLMG